MIYLKYKETFDRLPTDVYELYDDKKLVGMIQIRHRPSHGIGVSEKMASHIYYEILPEYRSRGYGKMILNLGLEEARKINLPHVFITCMENNDASKKIIEANGGIFIDEDMVLDGKVKMLKYQISLSGDGHLSP